MAARLLTKALTLPLLLTGGLSSCVPRDFLQIAQIGAPAAEVRLGEQLLVVTDAESDMGYLPLLSDEPQELPLGWREYATISEPCDLQSSWSLEPRIPTARRIVAQEMLLSGSGPLLWVQLEAEPLLQDSLLRFPPLYLSVYRGKRRVMDQELELVALPCALEVKDLDWDQRPEIIVTWHALRPEGYQRGATVLRLLQ